MRDRCAVRCDLPGLLAAGYGIDRLTMMITGKPSIRDVVLFPTLRSDE